MAFPFSGATVLRRNNLSTVQNGRLFEICMAANMPWKAVKRCWRYADNSFEAALTD